MVSDHSEGTFERLRYPFGGDRPSQTPHLTVSQSRIRDKTYKTNLGIDVRMLDSRLGITLDAYYDMGRELFTTFTGTSFYFLSLFKNSTKKDTFKSVN